MSNITNAYTIKNHDKLIKDLTKLLESGSSNDVTIVLKDGELKANKDILMARCAYFDRMLSNENFVEGQTNRIEMKTVEKAHMEIVLKYLFTGEATIENDEKSLNLLLQLINLCRFLMIDELRERIQSLAISYLISILNPRVAISTFILSDELQLDEIAKECTDYISKHWQDMSAEEKNRDCLKKLTAPQIMKILRVGEMSKDKISIFKTWYENIEDELTTEEKNCYYHQALAAMLSKDQFHH